MTTIIGGSSGVKIAGAHVPTRRRGRRGKVVTVADVAQSTAVSDDHKSESLPSEAAQAPQTTTTTSVWGQRVTKKSATPPTTATPPFAKPPSASPAPVKSAYKPTRTAYAPPTATTSAPPKSASPPSAAPVKASSPGRSRRAGGYVPPHMRVSGEQRKDLATHFDPTTAPETSPGRHASGPRTGAPPDARDPRARMAADGRGRPAYGYDRRPESGGAPPSDRQLTRRTDGGGAADAGRPSARPTPGGSGHDRPEPRDSGATGGRMDFRADAAMRREREALRRRQQGAAPHRASPYDRPAPPSGGAPPSGRSPPAHSPPERRAPESHRLPRSSGAYQPPITLVGMTPPLSTPSRRRRRHRAAPPSEIPYDGVRAAGAADRKADRARLEKISAARQTATAQKSRGIIRGKKSLVRPLPTAVLSVGAPEFRSDPAEVEVDKQILRETREATGSKLNPTTKSFMPTFVAPGAVAPVTLGTSPMLMDDSGLVSPDASGDFGDAEGSVERKVRRHETGYAQDDFMTEHEIHARHVAGAPGGPADTLPPYFGEAPAASPPQPQIGTAPAFEPGASVPGMGAAVAPERSPSDPTTMASFGAHPFAVGGTSPGVSGGPSAAGAAAAMEAGMPARMTPIAMEMERVMGSLHAIDAGIRSMDQRDPRFAGLMQQRQMHLQKRDHLMRAAQMQEDMMRGGGGGGFPGPMPGMFPPMAYGGPPPGAMHPGAFHGDGGFGHPPPHHFDHGDGGHGRGRGRGRGRGGGGGYRGGLRGGKRRGGGRDFEDFSGGDAAGRRRKHGGGGGRGGGPPPGAAGAAATVSHAPRDDEQQKKQVADEELPKRQRGGKAKRGGRKAQRPFPKRYPTAKRFSGSERRTPPKRFQFEKWEDFLASAESDAVFEYIGFDGLFEGSKDEKVSDAKNGVSKVSKLMRERCFTAPLMENLTISQFLISCDSFATMATQRTCQSILQYRSPSLANVRIEYPSPPISSTKLGSDAADAAQDWPALIPWRTLMNNILRDGPEHEFSRRLSLSFDDKHDGTPLKAFTPADFTALRPLCDALLFSEPAPPGGPPVVSRVIRLTMNKLPFALSAGAIASLSVKHAHLRTLKVHDAAQCARGLTPEVIAQLPKELKIFGFEVSADMSDERLNAIIGALRAFSRPTKGALPRLFRVLVSNSKTAPRALSEMHLFALFGICDNIDVDYSLVAHCSVSGGGSGALSLKGCTDKQHLTLCHGEFMELSASAPGPQLSYNIKGKRNVVSDSCRAPESGGMPFFSGKGKGGFRKGHRGDRGGVRSS